MQKALLVFGLISVTSLSSCGLFGSYDAPAPQNQPAEPPAPVVVDGMRTSYADVVQRTAPAVVRIEAEIRNRQSQQQGTQPEDDFFRQFRIPRQNQPRVERGMGSGVIVSADGTILTNNHVVEGADKITVRLADNKEFAAKLVGSDQPSDLAVLKIEAQNMPFLTLGNSDQVRVGDIVLAIGNPLGIGQSVTAGIISAKGRRTGLSDGSFEDFLQTDAPINRGNSGGALVNLTGELIGVNSQILAGGPSGGNIGIGFAIPSNMARSVMQQLIENGRVRRGRLGVGIQNLTSELAQRFNISEQSGVLINEVQPNSAGAKAGIQRGDVITAIDGERIEDSNVLRNKIAGTRPGTEIRLSLLRDGNPLEVTATLDELEVENTANQNRQQNNDGGENNPQNQSGKLGLSLQPMSPEMAKQMNLASGSEGLVVTDVSQSGPAAEAGIARGDVILEINRQQVGSIDAVQSALNASGSNPILVLISRGGRTVYLTIRPNP